MSVGRPPIYEDDETRKRSRRKQNRINQRKCRLRKRLREEIESGIPDSWSRDLEYKNELIKYLGQFEFNYFFTGTIDPDFIERKRMKKLYDEMKVPNQKLGIESSFKMEKKVGINSLRKYTERYIQFFFLKQMISRCFVVFELGENQKYHVHILLNTNGRVLDFEQFSEDHWLMGISLTNWIDNDQDKIRKLTYCVKQLRPSSRKIQDMNILDNWFIDGDYRVPKSVINTTINVSPIPDSYKTILERVTSPQLGLFIVGLVMLLSQ